MDEHHDQIDEAPYTPNVTGQLAPSNSGYIALVASVSIMMAAVAFSYAWHRLREETVPVVAPALQSRYKALRESLAHVEALRFPISAGAPHVEVAQTLRENPQLLGEYSALVAGYAELLTMLSPYQQAMLFCRERPERCEAMVNELHRMTVQPFAN